MTEILAAEINTFGPMPEADVLPSEDPIFVLSSSQLQEIISRAIQPLQDELLEQKAMIDGLREDMAAMKVDCESMNDLRCRDFINVSKRVIVMEKAAEAKKAIPTEKTQPHLDKLAGCLGEKRKRGIPALMGFKEAAQVTGLTKQRISQLRQSIEADGRFTIQSRGKKLYIGLRY
ncbi:MAG TPA: hypothetical protein PK712_08405 [Rectinema sp.]|nr:hypothetical protein [Rectinema sp.]